MIGERLGHFRILDKIGAGGMGEVYRARDEQLERDVALKILPATSFGDATARARLLREARTASKLNHPHVCTIHEVGETEGQAYIAMELVEGRPLSARLAEGPLRPDELLRYGLQLTDAVAHAHEHGVVHRDLKSSNVAVTPDGRLKVLDFGLSRPLGREELTEATTVTPVSRPSSSRLPVETLAYMAPEQLRAQPADTRSDVWALGVMLQEMATGQRPFQGSTPFELSSAVLSQPALPLPATVPAELQAVIGRCLRKDAGQRYRRASEVHAALEAVQSGTVPLRPQVARKGWTRRRWLAVAAAVVFVTAAAGLVVGVRSGKVRLPFSAATVHALAVLPLANLSGDPDQQYLVDGLTEALIGDLSKIGGALRVISRTSTQGYASRSKPIPQIARELGVDAIVEGSVAREGDRVRITAALIEAATERRLWSDRYDRNLTSILALQAEIALAVARSIRGTLSPKEQQRLSRRREVNPLVWEAYQKGMFLLNQSTPDSINKGMEYLHQAIEKDPTDAMAYAGLGNGYVTIAHGADPAPDSLFRAKAAAQTAIELDPELAAGVFTLGVIRGYDEWDWGGGERDLRRAIELNPSFAMAHYHLAWFLAIMGRLPEAIDEHIRAQESDPLNPLHTAWLGELYRMGGQYDKAIAEVHRAMELNPKFPVSQYVLGMVHAEHGRWDQAVEAMREAGVAARPWQWAEAAMCASAGRTEEARRLLADLNTRRVTPWTRFWRAMVYAALGDGDAAFKWANEEPHHPWIAAFVIKEWEVFTKPVKDDPRFEQLRRKMNVPK